MGTSFVADAEPAAWRVALAGRPAFGRADEEQGPRGSDLWRVAQPSAPARRGRASVTDPPQLGGARRSQARGGSGAPPAGRPPPPPCLPHLLLPPNCRSRSARRCLSLG